MTIQLSRPLRSLSLAMLLAGMGLVAPASAQDGLFMRQILGTIGIFPEEKPEIEYRERPGLVVPKELRKLRRPEDGDPAQRNAAWPVDPDLEARRREEARRLEPSDLLRGRRSVDGKVLTPDELARGRVARGRDLGEPNFTRNDQDGVRVSPEEWSKISRPQNQTPTYAAGTEPPRQYLTDPPTGLRVPASNAPFVRTMEDAEPIDNGRPKDAWKRLD